MMAFAVRDLGQPGYSIGFIVFVFLALVSLALTWIVKYARATATPKPVPGRSERLLKKRHRQGRRKKEESVGGEHGVLIRQYP